MAVYSDDGGTISGGSVPPGGYPVDVDAGVEADGVAVTPSRSDHKHHVSVAAPTATVDIGDAAAEGSADTLARSDHQHAFPAPGAGYPVDVDAGTEADGVATTPARSDHKHHVSVASPGASIDIGDSAAEGSASTLARSDHQHAFTAPVSAPPAIASAGATGAATTPARSDHTHAGVTTVDSIAGAVAVTSPLKSTSGSTITLANANTKTLPGGFVTNDIDTDANNGFLVPKLSAHLTVPVPKTPTGNVEGRKITFYITQETTTRTVTLTTGAGGFLFAKAGSSVGVTQTQFDTLLASMLNDEAMEISCRWSVGKDRWLVDGMAGPFA